MESLLNLGYLNLALVAFELRRGIRFASAKVNIPFPLFQRRAHRCAPATREHFRLKTEDTAAFLPMERSSLDLGQDFKSTAALVDYKSGSSIAKQGTEAR